MNRQRSNKQRKPVGSPGWMTTYSDMMSLLLTFFILLYSMSNIDVVKFRNISQSLQGVLSGLGYTKIIEGQSREMDIPLDTEIPIGENANSTLMQEILDVYTMVLDYVDEQELDADVSVNMSKRGVYVDIKEAILFDSGKAVIKTEGMEVLDKLKGIFNDFKNDIVIEGHTDDVPIKNSAFPSNWELSTGRSVSVLRYLAEKGGINPERLSAIGYGEYNPIVPNNSTRNRANNRRVNILIIFDEESGGINDIGKP